MTIEEEIPLVEEILAPWRGRIGESFAGYRNHVYRVVHFCGRLHPCTGEERRRLLIAAAFHDLGLWSDDTIDYLPPSIREATRYLEARGLDAWVPEVAAIIDLHHALRPVRDGAHPLVEPFRRADLCDVSLGAIRGDVPAAFVRRVRTAFPNAGFHRFLLARGREWFAAHPLSLPPFLKW